MRLLERCDALRRPERFAQALLACECDARGRGGDFPLQPYGQRPQLLAALQAALSINTAAIAEQAQAQGLTGPAVGERIRQARLRALTERARAANNAPDAGK